MFIQPPPTKTPQNTKPQETTKNILEPKQVITNDKENQKIVLNNYKKINKIYNDDLTGMKKKKEFKRFIKLIKAGKFTSAVVTADILGVSRQTISLWLSHPIAQKAMNEEVEQYINKIKGSRDWKASAYLLDKITAKDLNKTNDIDLSNLIVIQTSKQ